MTEEGKLERLHFWELNIWQKRNKKESGLLKSISQKYFNGTTNSNQQPSEEHRNEFTNLASDNFSKSRCTKSRKKTTCDQITQNFLTNGFTS